MVSVRKGEQERERGGCVGVRMCARVCACGRAGVRAHMRACVSEPVFFFSCVSASECTRRVVRT